MPPLNFTEIMIMSEDQFNSIMSVLLSINQSIAVLTESIKSDQIRSNQSIISDQIRSDQISKSHSKNQDNWIDLFLNECRTYSINCDNKDLRSVEQGILYYLQNKSKIISRKKYILSVLGPCQDMKSSKDISKDSSLIDSTKSKAISDENLILGFEKDLVLSNVPYLDENIFQKQMLNLDKIYRTFFTTYEAMMASEMKKNLFTAICMKSGLL